MSGQLQQAFAKNLRNFRDAEGMRLEALDERLHLDKMHLVDLERGEADVLP
jgi:cytoskeletal protein RodZ